MEGVSSLHRRRPFHSGIILTILICCGWGALLLIAQERVGDAVPAAASSGSPANAATEPLKKTSTEPLKELSEQETLWGAYKIGSWIQTRTVTTNAQGKTTYQGESTTTFESLEKDGYLLKQVEAVDMGGKMVQGEPQTKKFDFYHQPLTEDGQAIAPKTLPPETLTLGNRAISCGVRVYEKATPQIRWKTKVWFNPDVAPYVLCTETTKTSVATAEQPEILLSRTKTIVTNPPSKSLRGALFGAYRLKTTRNNAEGTTITVSECSLKIPGGVESETTWDYDRENNLIRTSTTQIVNSDYETAGKWKVESGKWGVTRTATVRSGRPMIHAPRSTTPTSRKENL